MFAFGIIVSPLPYAAVVVLYAFYLLFVQFNDSYDSQYADDIQEEKQIILDTETESSFQDVYIVEISDNNLSQNNNICFKDDITPRSVSYVILHLFESRPAKPALTEFSYSLFSRPPPAIA